MENFNAHKLTLFPVSFKALCKIVRFNPQKIANCRNISSLQTAKCKTSQTILVRQFITLVIRCNVAAAHFEDSFCAQIMWYACCREQYMFFHDSFNGFFVPMGVYLIEDSTCYCWGGGHSPERVAQVCPEVKTLISCLSRHSRCSMIQFFRPHFVQRL